MQTYLKSVLFSAAAIFATTCCIAQQSDWAQSSDWTLYSIHNRKIWNIPLDSLDQFPHKTLNNDSIFGFVKNASVLPPGTSPAWMGEYVATCTLHQKKRKIAISTYGGFFFDQTEGKYYQLPKDLQAGWLNYLADVASSLRTPTK